MKFRARLRFRVGAAFALLGALASLGLATALYIQITAMEERLIAETLTTELDDFIKRQQVQSESDPNSGRILSIRTIGPDEEGAEPVLRNLNEGLHLVTLSGIEYYAEVKINNSWRYIALYAAEPLRHREQQIQLFLGASVIAMIILSALLGIWLAGRVISPVSSLAARVAGLKPDRDPPPLAPNYASDEVGELAAAFDAYLKRLKRFIERERNFTADISHELRTPLTVISGAAEVLSADPNLDEPQRRRVERILRVSNDASEMARVLLTLARERQGVAREQGSCIVSEVVYQVAENHRYLLKNRDVTLQVVINAEPVLPFDCALLKVVLGNLLRNAFGYTESGTVSVEVDEDAITIVDTGIGINASELTRVFDRYYRGGEGDGEGIGLSLVRRICNCFGWQIDLVSEEGKGTKIRLGIGDDEGVKPSCD